MLLDTSTIIDILLHPKTSSRFRLIKGHVQSEELYVFIIQLAELSDWCLENKVSPQERVEAVKKFASIIPLDEEICLSGSRIKNERRRSGYKDFSLMDGLILASARTMGEKVLTFDGDFTDEKDCIILE